MQIKRTMCYHFTPIRMPLTIKKRDNKCSQRCEEKRTLVYCWWECKPVLSHRKQYSDSSRNRTSITFCNPTFGYKGNKNRCQDIYLPLHCHLSFFFPSCWKASASINHPGLIINKRDMLSMNLLKVAQERHRALFVSWRPTSRVGEVSRIYSSSLCRP